MDPTNKKVAILVHDYFEQAEFEQPLAALKDAGVAVTVVSAAEKQLRGMQHAEKGDKFQADLLLKDAVPEEYDALVLPGGVINGDALRLNEDAQQWAASFLEQGKPVAAICHAPWLLVSADVVEGRRLTSWPTLQDDIRNAGGEWVDQKVVVDDNLITSRKPDDLPAFCEAIIGALQSPPPGEVTEPETAEPLDAQSEKPEGSPDERPGEEGARLRALGYDRERDQLTPDDTRDILDDEDLTDPDDAHLSDVVPGDEQDGTQ